MSDDEWPWYSWPDGYFKIPALRRLATASMKNWFEPDIAKRDQRQAEIRDLIHLTERLIEDAILRRRVKARWPRDRRR